MANEQNYTMVLLQNENTVMENMVCSNCQNDDMDMLQIDDDDNVLCLNCQHEYKV
jgi:formylmethanofuran dehydrogenase subunit E